jgi:hypothetical protein
VRDADHGKKDAERQGNAHKDITDVSKVTEKEDDGDRDQRKADRLDQGALAEVAGILAVFVVLIRLLFHGGSLLFPKIGGYGYSIAYAPSLVNQPFVEGGSTGFLRALILIVSKNTKWLVVFEKINFFQAF